MSNLNIPCLDSLCGALGNISGAGRPLQSAPALETLTEYANNVFGFKKADRVFMYHPDAIGTWIFQKYDFLLKNVKERTELEVAFKAVMPSVTPVCFATMYTGSMPSVHGIVKYEKPVLKIDTLFDALIRSSKKTAIVAETNCSIARIFLERDMDYYIYDTIAAVNAKAVQLICEDVHDFICVYNGNFDSTMHKYGPESLEALSELKANAESFALFDELISSRWRHHNTLIGFAPDHGCHSGADGKGTHGLDIPEDMNTVHLYKAQRGV